MDGINWILELSRTELITMITAILIGSGLIGQLTTLAFGDAWARKTVKQFAFALMLTGVIATLTLVYNHDLDEHMFYEGLVKGGIAGYIFVLGWLFATKHIREKEDTKK